MKLPFNVHLEHPVTSGVIDIAEQMTAIDWTISDQFGFESMDITIQGTVEDVLWYFDQLRSEVIVYDRDALVCWEGMLNSVDAQIGQETHSRSLDGMANRVKVRYTTVLGSPAVTASSSDTTSIARYGTKDYVERIGEMTATPAAALRDRILNDRRWPRKRPSSTIQTGDIGAITITLHFVGWYFTLDWLLTSVATTTNAVTTTQVTTLLASFVATNANFISSTTTNVAASGLSDTQYVPPDTTYRAAIERLLMQGTSSGVRLAWGVYEDRLFWVQTWAGEIVTTVAYRRSLGSGIIEDAAGATVMPWRVRPNANYEILELLDVTKLTDEPDAAARYYVARVAFHADGSGMGVTLEPTETNDITAQLARLNRG